jgi:hypothetical protein
MNFVYRVPVLEILLCCWFVQKGVRNVTGQFATSYQDCSVVMMFRLTHYE